MANLTSGLISGLGILDQLDRYDDMKQETSDSLDALAADPNIAPNFTGFTVSGYGGSGSTDAAGNVTFALDPEQQMQSGMLTSMATDQYMSAAAPQDDRIADAYEAIRATQRPEEERQRLNLESRLHAQGRLGLASDQYGGSAEMFGFDKAVQENRG